MLCNTIEVPKYTTTTTTTTFENYHIEYEIELKFSAHKRVYLVDV